MRARVHESLGPCNITMFACRSDKVREAAAKAASGLSGTAEGREMLMGAKSDPIEKLVPMMEDKHQPCTVHALAAVVNRATSASLDAWLLLLRSCLPVALHCCSVHHMRPALPPDLHDEQISRARHLSRDRKDDQDPVIPC